MMKKVLPVVAFFAPALALAQTGAAQIISKLTSILNLIIPLIIGLAVVYFLWGLLTYVMAGAEEDKSKARGVMIYGIVTIFVMVSVWGLVNLLIGTFGLNTAIPTTPCVPPGC